MEIARLQIAVDALQAKVARIELDKLNKSARGADAGAGKLSASTAKLGIALAGMVTVSTLRAMQKLSEEFILLQSRIGRLSESSEEAAVTYGRLSDIARRTGASLGDTVKLWEALNFTLKDLGGNNDQVIRFTETLQKIGAIGGNSAEEMSGALRQLGQALAGGVVRGEEFNSIIESMPALLREIAAGMGVPFGDLRQIMLDGGLTAEKVLLALQERGMMVDQEFAKIPRTVSQAAESLRTDLGNAIAELDRTIGASSGFAKLLDLLSKGIRFTAGDFTDLEQLNMLTAERARVQDSLAAAEKRTVLSSKERAAFDQRLIGINEQIVEIQDRRIKQQTEEGQAIGGNSKKAAEARQLTLEGLEEERKLAAMTALERAQYKAEQLLGIGATEQEIAKARDLAAQTYALGNAHKSVIGDLKIRKTEAERTARAEQAGNEANAMVISRLAEEIYQTTLNAEELAKRQATLSLNQYATPEQIASVQMLAGELQRVEDIAARKKEFGADPAATIRGTVTPLSGGAFDDQAARFDAEREAEELRYAEQLQRTQDAKALNIEVIGGYYALEQQMAQENADRLAQIEQARNDQMLTSMGSAFGQMSSDLMAFSQTFADENSAMFKVAKAAAIAQTIIQTYQGAQQAFTSLSAIPIIGPALGAAAAAAAVAGGMARVSAINSQAAPSFDGGGFTGSGARSGGMDGKGGFLAMMHPNETVLDHTKGQGNGGGGVTINVIESKDKAGQQETRTDADGKESVDVFVSDIYGDGPRGKAIQRAFGLSRVGV